MRARYAVLTIQPSLRTTFTLRAAQRYYHGRLFQHWLVNTYGFVAGERLSYLQRNQMKLRVMAYGSLREVQARRRQQRQLLASADTGVGGGDMPDELDYGGGNGDTSEFGRRVVLPSTFIGGPRFIAVRK